MTTSLLDHKPLLEKYFKRHPQNLSGFSFVNLFAWQEHWRYDIGEIDNCLCVFARNEWGAFMPLPPLGTDVRRETVAACFRRMDAVNGATRYSRIENVSEYLLNDYPPDQYERYLKAYEYCYYRKEIAALTGAGYKSKRPDLNHFLRHHAARFLPLDADMLPACRGLYDQWAASRRERITDDIYCHMLEENLRVHQLVLENAGALGITARVVEVDGRISAYTCGYPVNDRVFCVLLEVADLAVRGLPVFTFQRFCSDPFVARHPFINVMDDSGMENMTGAKMSFRPRILFPAYVMTQR